MDANHLQDALNLVNDHYQNKDCKGYHDYRELLARDDIDAVMIAVPDHWHELVATEAARRKKDIYGEKPLAKTIAEQQAIVRAVEKNKIIWQMGSWQRSVPTFHKAAEIVRNGLIGTVTHVEVGLPAGYADFSGEGKEAMEKISSLPDKITDLSKVTPGTPAWNLLVTEPPAELDYNTWIGPSKMEPYIAARSHKNWRWNYNTGGGQLMDWIGHHCDIAHWGLGFDHSGPSEIEGHGEFPAADAVWNTCPKYRIELKYPQDITMTIAGGYDDIKSGVKWIGTEGWVWVDRGGFDASNPGLEKGQVPARRTAQGEALRIQRPSAEFSGLREVAPAHHHARGNRASLGHSRPSGSDLHARGAQNLLGCPTRKNPSRPRGQQIADPRVSRTLAFCLKK